MTIKGLDDALVCIVAAQLVTAAQTKQLLHHLRGEPIDEQAAMRPVMEAYVTYLNACSDVLKLKLQSDRGRKLAVDRSGLQIVTAEIAEGEGTA